MRGSFIHPTRLIPLGFLGIVAAGTGLLMLPWARAGEAASPFLTALFTATSAVCVTGLVVVDTGTYWSPFGQAVIALLIQVGGFGVMTAATLMGLLVARRLRLSDRLAIQTETRSIDLADVQTVVRFIFLVTLTLEAVVALVLGVRFALVYDLAPGAAAWSGVFHAISAFNNAGFGLYANSLTRFVGDWMISGAVMVAVIIGGLGSPVLFELRKSPLRPRNWSVHTKLTLIATLALLVFGALVTLAYEWGNAATLGPLGPAEKILAGLFHSVMTRTAGFNSIDIGAIQPGTQAVTEALMLIGGGSAGTAGGLKVSTFVILGLIVWAEIRGEPDVVVFRRRIAHQTQRQALAVVLIALAVIAIGQAVLVSVSSLPFDALLFEAISAFATVGLSTGITAELPAAGQAVIIALMFIGRIGTITFATALALNTRQRPFRYPEERPIVG